MAYWKAFNKNKNSQNNTGFYRVSKRKEKNNKFRFVYSINNEVLKVNITSTNLYKLKEKVIKNNLQWFIIDKKKAFKTCINENINPLVLNSNVNPHYINYKFNYNDVIAFETLKNCWSVFNL